MKITIELDVETYEKAKRSEKTHRQIFCDGLGVPYEEKKLGRPAMDEGVLGRLDGSVFLG